MCQGQFCAGALLERNLRSESSSLFCMFRRVSPFAAPSTFMFFALNHLGEARITSKTKRLDPLTKKGGKSP